MNTSKVDTIIIGASISGLFAAYLLSLTGCKFKLISSEKSTLPKACGEGLSSIGIKYLTHAGIWCKDISEQYSSFDSYKVKTSRGAFHLKNFEAFGTGVDREELEGRMFKAATNNKFSDVEIGKVTKIMRTDDSWKVWTKNGISECKNLLIACGKTGRALLEDAPAKPNINRFGMAFRASGKWKSDADKPVYIESREGQQIILTPIRDNLINLSIMRSKPASNDHELKTQVVSEALNFAKTCGFDVANQEECRGSTAVDGLITKAVKDVYFIGDSAEIFDPIGGMGMSHALLSASLAAESVSASINNPKAVNCWKKYIRRRERYAKVFRLLTLISYNLIVKENYFLSLFCIKFPTIAGKLPGIIEKCVPVVGAAGKVRKLTTPSLSKAFSSLNQEII